MKAEDELTLSYYKKIDEIDAARRIDLVKHIESSRIFVRKTLSVFDPEVFRTLQKEAPYGIPEIYEVVESNKELIIIEEYINGRTLADILNEKTFSVRESSQIVIELCRILQPLHDHDPQIVHRDIKPSNIMLKDDGKVFLLDFNAGKHYKEGQSRDTELIGTAGYAAPEQYGFGQSDARTDIYALGVLLSKLAGIENGKTDLNEKAQQDFRNVIEKCTRIDPEDRYQNVSELAAGLNRLAGSAAKRSDKETENSWLLPGFRTFSPGKMIAAALWYLFILSFAIPGISASKSDDFGVADGICLAIWLFASTLVCGNYRGIAGRLPLTRSEDTRLRFAGYVLYSFIIMIVMAGIATAVS